MENGNLPFQAKLWSYIYGFAESLILRCAVQLDLANVVHNHGTPMSLAEICPQLPIQPVNQVALFRLMRYLVHMNLFTRTCSLGEAKYALAPPGRLLVKGQENCMVSSILAITDKEFMAPWHYLKDGLSCERGTSFENVLGTDIWGYMAEHPEKNHLFNEAMANDTMLIMSALVKQGENIFAGVNTLVDVGGGTGTAVRTIAKAFPHVKCTVYDLPHVIHDSPGSSDVKFVEGDMFKHIPNADAIMLKCILHDWDDQECIEILKRCKEAVPRDGGKVIIIDVVLNADTEHPYTNMRLTLDLDMMINTGGKERTEEEWKKLFHSAGYEGYKIRDISAVQSVIEVYPGLLLRRNTS